MRHTEGTLLIRQQNIRFEIFFSRISTWRTRFITNRYSCCFTGTAWIPVLVLYSQSGFLFAYLLHLVNFGTFKWHAIYYLYELILLRQLKFLQIHLLTLLDIATIPALIVVCLIHADFSGIYSCILLYVVV